MKATKKELIEIEQRLLKTISGNGLAISRFIQWLKSINSDEQDELRAVGKHEAKKRKQIKDLPNEFDNAENPDRFDYLQSF